MFCGAGLASPAVVSLAHGNGVGCRPERNNHPPPYPSAYFAVWNQRTCTIPGTSCHLPLGKSPAPAARSPPSLCGQTLGRFSRQSVSHQSLVASTASQVTSPQSPVPSIRFPVTSYESPVASKIMHVRGRMFVERD
jgi:hypothetical protein